jgi:hypothetical protein
MTAPTMYEATRELLQQAEQCLAGAQTERELRWFSGAVAQHRAEVAAYDRGQQPAAPCAVRDYFAGIAAGRVSKITNRKGSGK